MDMTASPSSLQIGDSGSRKGASYLCCDSGSFRLAVHETQHDLPPRLDRQDLENPMGWMDRLLLWIGQQS